MVGVRALVALSPPDLPRAGAIGVDGAVFAFALALTTLIGLAVGVDSGAAGVARRPARASVQEARGAPPADSSAPRGALVVAEVALALVLLVGSGLLLRSLQRLFAVAPGFDAAHAAHHAGPDVRPPLRRRRRAPSVLRRGARGGPARARRRAAAFTSQLPLSGDRDESTACVRVDADATGADGDSGAFRYAVSPGYFETMGIPLRRGRLLDGATGPARPRAVVISESFAKRRFPGQRSDRPARCTSAPDRRRGTPSSAWSAT